MDGIKPRIPRGWRELDHGEIVTRQDMCLNLRLSEAGWRKCTGLAGAVYGSVSDAYIVRRKGAAKKPPKKIWLNPWD